MTPQELKNSILQRAIEGKLVDQRPEEGTGEELYKIIQAEKKKLIKEGKIKKQKVLPQITDEEIPFEIPEKWKWVRLGDVILKLTDGAHRTPTYKKNGVPFLSVKDISSGKIDYSNCKFISRNEHEKLFERCNPEKGDLLLTKVGTTGIPVIVETDDEFSLFVSVALLKLPTNLINIYFLKHLINSPLVQVQVKENTRGVGNKNWVMRDIANTIIPLPPLGEQKRIVEKIEDLMPLVEAYEESWQRLEDLNKKFPEDMKKSLLQEAIKGKLVDQRPEEGTGEELYKTIQAEKKKLIKEGQIKKQKALPEITEEEIPFDIPENWKWVRLGEIMDFQGGYAFKSSSYVSKSKNQVIRLGNVKQNQLLTDTKPVYIADDLAEEVENYKIEQDDIIVTMTGTRRKKDYFYVTLITQDDISEKVLYLNQRVGCFRLAKSVYNKYILKVLQSNPIRNIIFERETGTANQGNIGSEDIKTFIYIPLPPLGEQKRIVKKIEELLPLCDELMVKSK